MTIFLCSFFTGFHRRNFSQVSRVQKCPIWGFNTFGLLPKKPKEVIVKNSVIIPSRNFDFIQVTHMGL